MQRAIRIPDVLLSHPLELSLHHWMSTANVFTSNVSNLNLLLQGNVEGFAKQMLQEQLISPAVASNSKDTTKIIDNCLAKMPS